MSRARKRKSTAKIPPRSAPTATEGTAQSSAAVRKRSLWVAVVVATLVFAAGVGGGVFIRSRRAASEPRNRPIAGSQSTATPTAAAKTTTTRAAINRRRDPLAQRAAEQAFGPQFRRGYANFQGERYSQAVGDFQRAVEIAPHLAEGHLYLGESYAKLFLSTKAEAAYRAALEQTSDFRPAQEKLAMLLYERGAYREALALLETMDRQTPDDAFVQSEQAINYLALGEPKAAIPLLVRFNAARGRPAGGLAQLGRAHEMTGDAEQAEQFYREALELDRHFALAHHWLGLLLARTGRDEQAQPSLAEYDRLRKLQTMEHELAMALLRGPGSPAQLAKLAETRFQLGKYPDAWQTLERAERLAPGDPRLAALRRRWADQAPKHP